MDALSDKEKINRAIAQFDGSTLADEAERRIGDLFGPRIAAASRAVYEDAMDCPVDWRTTRMDDALFVLGDFLDEKYPWLTDEARQHLNYAFIMVWK